LESHHFGQVRRPGVLLRLHFYQGVVPLLPFELLRRVLVQEFVDADVATADADIKLALLESHCNFL